MLILQILQKEASWTSNMATGQQISTLTPVIDMNRSKYSFGSYIFQLALQVSKVVLESLVLREQLCAFSILGAQRRVKSSPLGQSIGQITLLLLVPGDRTSEEV